MSNLGDFVVSTRERLGMNQGDLVKASGVSQPALSDIERGRNKSTSADVRRRLATALGISHVELLVAAGELTPDEVAPKEPSDPVLDDVFTGLIPMARRIDWTKAERIATIRTIFEMYMKEDRTGIRQEGARIMGEKTETVIEQRDRRVP